MSENDKQPDIAELEAIADIVAGGEAEFDYLRVQINAFEQLEDQYDALMPYNGNDWYHKGKYMQRKESRIWDGKTIQGRSECQENVLEDNKRRQNRQEQLSLEPAFKKELPRLLCYPPSRSA